MTEGGKDVIKKTGDRNWDMERMQLRKNEGTFQAKMTMLTWKQRQLESKKRRAERTVINQQPVQIRLIGHK